MKDKIFINWNFEWQVQYYLEMYIRDFGYNQPLYSGKSRSKLYAADNTDFQVKIWQTKTLIKAEVIR